MRATLALIFALALSTCGGLQVLAQPVHDEVTSQRYELHGVYADNVPPITEQQLAQPAAVQPITINQPNATSGLDFSPVVSSLQQMLNMVLTALIGGLATWLSLMASKWLGVKIDANEITKDLDMTKYANIAVDKAIAYALQMLGLDAADLKNVQVRNTFLRIAADFLLKQFPDVTHWVTSSGTLSQYIEAHLPKEAALPSSPLKTISGEPVPGDVAAAMSAKPA